jgi:hypothetical protein
MMRIFLKRIFLFSVPVIFIFSVVLLPLYSSHEYLYDIKQTISQNKKYLIGYAFNENNYRFLKWSVMNNDPKRKVIALGSSRVLQFRDEMFTERFYNVGYTITSVNDLLPFMKSIPKDKYPKYLILGLDQWMFNANWDDLQNTNSEDYWASSYEYSPSIVTLKRTIYGLLKEEINFYYNSSLQENVFKIGLSAHGKSAGIRNDGSMNYGSRINYLDGFNDEYDFSLMFGDTYKRIEKGNRRFEPGFEVGQKHVQVLISFLDFCKMNNIIVVGFLPPFAQSVYSRMLESKNHNYINQIYNKLSPHFDALGFELYDFTDGEKINSKNTEFIDGFHGGERTYQRLLIEILRQGSALNTVCDSDKLIEDLNKSQSRYLVY